MALSDVLDPGTKILVADDVKSARVAVRAALAQLGYSNTVEAETGAEMMKILEATPDIGLIISDWQMPDMEGIDVARKLMEDDRYATVPFVMATAKSEWLDMVQATFAGVWGYIVKPVSAATLGEELENAIREGREEPKNETQA